MNVEEMKRVYTRGYETSFGMNPLGDRGGWMTAGVQAVALWARNEALREAKAHVTALPTTFTALYGYTVRRRLIEEAFEDLMGGGKA